MRRLTFTGFFSQVADLADRLADGVINGVKHNKVACLLGILFAYLYLHGMSDHGLLEPIESINASVSLTMAASDRWFQPRIGGALVAGRALGSWWLGALGLRLFGWSEFSVRIGSVLAALGLTWLAGKIALGLKGKRYGGLAAMICAAMTGCFFVSQLASSHAVYALLTGLAMMNFWRGGRGALLTAHGCAVLAFIVHGPEGVLVPWAALISHHLLTRAAGWSGLSDPSGLTNGPTPMLTALSFWPGVVVSVAGVGLWIVLLLFVNPSVLGFMTCRALDALEPGFFKSILMILLAFTPWTGFVLHALSGVLSSVARATRRHVREFSTGGSIESESSAEASRDAAHAYLTVWLVVFAVAALLTGDTLMLSGCVVPAAVLVSGTLGGTLNPEQSDNTALKRLQGGVVANLLVTAVTLVSALVAGPSGGRMTMVLWSIFVTLALFASWHYTIVRDGLRMRLGTCLIALACLLPLSGLLNLAAELGTPRDAGLALKRVVAREDTLVQYGVNRPSLFFYTAHDYKILRRGASGTLKGVAMKQQGINATALQLLWPGRERVFLVLRVDEAMSSPLQGDVYDLELAQNHENRFAVLSNRN